MVTQRASQRWRPNSWRCAPMFWSPAPLSRQKLFRQLRATSRSSSGRLLIPLARVLSTALPAREETLLELSLTPQILWGKRLELIAELIGHRPTKVTWLGSPGDIMFKRSLAAVMEAAEQMGVKVDNFEAREPSDFDRIFAASAGSDAVLVQFDILTLNHRPQIAELATRYRLPAIYDNRDLCR